jgi:hypothetical protein
MAFADEFPDDVLPEIVNIPGRVGDNGNLFGCHVTFHWIPAIGDCRSMI